MEFKKLDECINEDGSINLDIVREFFARDVFASKTVGAQIEAAAKGEATCTLDITPAHRNAMGNVMGGAIFTLADYALAVACNIGENPTVGISNTIDYFAQPKGERLIAHATVDKSGRTVGFYVIEVTDELGTHVARMTAVCSRRA